MDKFQIYVLVGLPGSGKSTYANRHMNDKPIISRDAIRLGILKDEEEYFSHEHEVFKIYIDAIINSCKSIGCAVADATHISRASREKFFYALDTKIGGCYDTIMIYFNTPFEICSNRNRKRSGRACVPNAALHSMFRQFSRPMYEEHESIKEIWDINMKEKC